MAEEVEEEWGVEALNRVGENDVCVCMIVDKYNSRSLRNFKLRSTRSVSSASK